MKNNTQPKVGELEKVVVKIIDKNTKKLRWVALCQVSRRLYYQFLLVFGLDREDLIDQLKAWAKADFNTNLTLATLSSVKLLRRMIFDFYRRLYPEIYYSGMPRENWIRVWVNDHMMSMLDKHGEVVFYE